MFITVGNWDLLKADEDENSILVKIIANQLTLDKQNEKMLPEAFNKATIKEFLDTGIIDWHHMSVLGGNSKERAEAIIGKPVDFKWENGKPVVYARLAKSHPIVKNSIMPNLQAGLPVFAASVGGLKTKTGKTYDDDAGQIVNVISGIRWNHLALTGSPYVVNSAPGVQVSLVKAEIANDVHLAYKNFDTLIAGYEMITREETLRKALEANTSITDSKDAIDIGALQTESLEGSWDHPLKKEIIKAILDEKIPANKTNVKNYLLAKGCSPDEADEFLKCFGMRLNKAIEYAARKAIQLI